MTSIPKNPIFNDDDAARAHLEKLRWPEGVICVHCGAFGEAISKVEKTDTRRKPADPTKRRKPARAGRYYCKDCDGTFTVTVGTVMEDSHVPLHKWLYAFRQFLASKNGISAHQMHRDIGVSYKTAWFMCHRIREALRQGGLAPPVMGGGQSKIIEADEMFIGRKRDVPDKKIKKNRGFKHKHAVLTLIDRSTGEARSFHLDDANAANIVPIVRKNVAKETTLSTDEASHYRPLDREYYHGTVNHSIEEWVVGEFHVNSAEGYFSHFKRSVRGTYSHISEKHLHRYLAEFDFRYSNRVKLGVDDTKRTERALRGIEGKRLTYRRIGRPRSEARSEG
jgi:transposase-like protein